MNTLYSARRAKRFSFGDDSVLAILLLVAIAQIVLAFNESAATFRPMDQSSPIVSSDRGQDVARQVRDTPALHTNESTAFPSPVRRG